LSEIVKGHLPAGQFRDLLTDGLIAGVGGVLVFLPLVVFLMLGLSLLEDTGYMARAAFVMDKFFHLFGLHGRSFIPFMLATGCAVPAIMAARSLANKRDRILTILVTPFMMCGAKTPVIAMLAAAFFPRKAGLVFWGIWFFSWFVALSIALIFRKTFFKGDQSPFVMELPPYRWPSLRSVLIHMWQRSVAYLRKAGTIILAAAVIIWIALNYPKAPTTVQTPVTTQSGSELLLSAPQDALDYSFAGKAGRALEPVLKWAGFDWKLSVSLVAGLAAKEIIISTLGILYGVTEETAEAASKSHMTSVGYQISRDPSYSPLMAISLMVFVMLYTPCLATLVMVKKELGRLRWALFQAAFTLGIAYLMAVIIFKVGSFLLPLL
ncbi:MAG: ferrous iron transport protein B, partial [Candidatus Neomarinimicrobiota bacterium]